ncbi:MAG: asparagine synthase-related protein, partial [Pyrinomonadaceae bacterium]
YILADDFEPLSSPGTYSEIIFNGPDFDSSFLLHREICIRAKAKQNSALFWGIGGDFLMGSIAHYFDLFASGKLLTLYRYVQHDYEIWWRIVLWHIFGLFKKKPEQTQKALPKWIHRRFERWQGYQHNDISPRSAQFDSPASEYEFYRYINPQFERMMSYMYSLARKQTIEFYNPFLSPSMIETMFALPPHLRYQARIGKYVLRRAMARVLPREIIENGVETTFDQYLSHGLRKNWRVVQPLIRDAELAKMDFIDEREVFRLFQAFEAGDDANREEVWRLISTEMWLRWFKEFNKARTVVRE